MSVEVVNFSLFEKDYIGSGDGYRACSLVGKRTKAHLASSFYFYSVKNFRAVAPSQYKNLCNKLNRNKL